MKSFYIFIIIFLFNSIQSNCQSLERIVEAGEKSLSSKNYYDAYSKYKEALEFEPTNAIFINKAAESARLFGAYKIAANYYDTLLVHENNNQFPQTSYWLGQTHQIQGDYQKAITAYKIFISEHSGEDPSLIAIATKEIKACEWAIQQLQNPVSAIKVVRLPEGINSTFSDFAPAFWKEQFWYSSLRFENTKEIYIPKRYVASVLSTKNETSPVKVIDENYIDRGLNIAHSSFNKDFTKVYFTICEDLNDYDKRCDLFVSPVDKNGTWGSKTKLPDYINKPGTTTTQPHLNYIGLENKETLFFVSDRSGGKGQLDIWYTEIDKIGNYSEPINCADLNTNQDDITPFFHTKSNTLYYSSKGHLGMGGYDVYSTHYLDDHWGTAKNSGVPINSSFDDVYFMISDLDTIGFLASNRTGSQFLDDASEACCLDIFKLKLPACNINLEALVYNFYSKKELYNATVTLYDIDRPLAKPIVLSYEQTNKYNFDILCDRNYKIIATKPGYIPDTANLYSGKPSEFTIITKKLFLKPKDVKLEVLTFHKITGDSLNNVTVTLYDLDDRTIPPITITNLNSNLTQFNIIPCHTYKITGLKKEFSPAELKFTIDCNSVGTITHKLYLIDTIFSLLPVSLYFDNDRPDPSTLAEITKLSYSQTYFQYYSKKEEYQTNYIKIQPFINASSPNDMLEFFEKGIKNGYDRFNEFLLILEKDLRKGKKYEIFVKGYASPLAKREYNLNLSHRRIHSIFNEFYKYRSGTLIKYINSGQLKLSEKPFGENTAPNGISDNKQDLRSIFTVEASKERRVEIVEIK
ncbi:MAG: hypothetical protein IPO16_05895 [Saprospiraceae bacterium]|nr:hypothetical protein [Saprospiraceae bacterium]